MITVVTPQERPFYAAQLAEMHRLRHRVFKERMQWDVRSINGLEFDTYDELDPTYLLAGDGVVEGTWRILPTDGPYMLRDVFPELLGVPPAPDSPSIWETSRFAVDHETRDTDGKSAVGRITGMLFCGLVEYALSQGITEVWTVYDIRIGRLLKWIGCQPAWEGPRHRYGSTISVAGRFEISERVLGDLRHANNVVGSVIRASGAPPQKYAA